MRKRMLVLLVALGPFAFTQDGGLVKPAQPDAGKFEWACVAKTGKKEQKVQLEFFGELKSSDELAEQEPYGFSVVVNGPLVQLDILKNPGFEEFAQYQTSLDRSDTLSEGATLVLGVKAKDKNKELSLVCDLTNQNRK